MPQATLGRADVRRAVIVVLAAASPLVAAAGDFLPGFVSDAGANELAPALTPDGRTLFLVRWKGRWGADAESPRTLYRADLGAHGWSVAQPWPFSGEHEDDDPFVSPDGRYLYFVSERPGPGGERGSADIFRADLGAGTPPERLPAPINGPAAEFSPVVVAAGHLYFASDRAGGYGQGDLYRAAWNGASFEAPERLGPALNSPTGEWNLWVAPDESVLVLEASSRPTNVSVPGDLYVSVRGPAGWSPALPLATLNTDGSDLLPRVTPDGRTLLYGSAPLGGRASIRRADWETAKHAALAPLRRTLVVAGRSSHDLSFVSLVEGRVTRSQPVARGPHLLSNNHGGLVAVSGYGIFPEPHVEPVARRPPFQKRPEPVLSLLEAASGELRGRWALSGCAHPHASWLAEGAVWVTCEEEGELLALDPATGAERRRLATGQRGSHVLAYHAATRTLAVSNTEDGSVSLFDLATEERTIVPLGAGAEGSTVVEAHGELWVGNAGDGSVSVVSFAERRETARIDGVCGMPIALAGAGGRVWLVCFASRELVGLDVASRSVVVRQRLAEAPLNLLLHPELPLAYVSLPRQNAVAEIDLAQGAELRRMPVGIEPDGLRWAE